MTWPFILVLVVSTWAIRFSGLVLLVGRQLPAVVTRLLSFVPAALLASLVAVQTVSTEGQYAIDARLVGVLAALVAVVFRAPFGRVFIIGVGTTALARWIGT